MNGKNRTSGPKWPLYEERENKPINGHPQYCAEIERQPNWWPGGLRNA